MADGVFLEMSKNEAEYGIAPEGRCFVNILDISYISGAWYPLNGGRGWTFGPKIGRMLGKLFWSTSILSRTHNAAWRSGVAESFLPTFGRCPVLKTFLRRQITTDKRVKIEKYTADFAEDSDIAWDMYLATKYHLSQSEITSFDDYLKILPREAVMCEHDVATRIMCSDMSDPADRPLAI